jgi:hypothetical protein
MRYKVREGTQINYKGVVYAGGQTFEVDQEDVELANYWTRRRLGYPYPEQRPSKKLRPSK